MIGVYYVHKPGIVQFCRKHDSKTFMMNNKAHLLYREQIWRCNIYKTANTVTSTTKTLNNKLIMILEIGTTLRRRRFSATVAALPFQRSPLWRWDISALETIWHHHFSAQRYSAEIIRTLRVAGSRIQRRPISSVLPGSNLPPKSHHLSIK